MDRKEVEIETFDTKSRKIKYIYINDSFLMLFSWDCNYSNALKIIKYPWFQGSSSSIACVYNFKTRVPSRILCDEIDLYLALEYIRDYQMDKI